MTTSQIVQEAKDMIDELNHEDIFYEKNVIDIMDWCRETIALTSSEWERIGLESSGGFLSCY